jgi:predicted kinase
MSPVLIIVLGLPASGKTSLAKELSQRLHLPLFYRDELKEILFDQLGFEDREWSKILGKASYALLYQVILNNLGSNVTTIVESNFNNQYDKDKFAALQSTTDCKIIQVLCKSKPETLELRFEVRTQTGERHPGHVDGANLDEMRDLLYTTPSEFLDLPGERVEVDTDDFKKVNYVSIAEEVKQLL